MLILNVEDLLIWLNSLRGKKENPEIAQDELRALHARRVELQEAREGIRAQVVKYKGFG